MPNNRTPCVVRGKAYRSIAAAAEGCSPAGVSAKLVRVRITNMGWPLERAMLTPLRGRRVEVKGEWYPSIKEAWLAWAPDGLLYQTVLNRMARGWEAWRAVCVKPAPNSLHARHLGEYYETE